MKILFLVPSMGYGGAERVISILTNELTRRGHNVGLFLAKPSTQSVYKLDENILLYSPSKLEGAGGIMKSIRSFTKSFDPDVVVPFLPYQCIYTVFGLLGTKYPVVVCERNDPARIQATNVSKLHYVMRDLSFSMAKGAVFQTVGAQQYFSKSIQKKSTVILNPLDVSALPDIYFGERDKRIVCVGRLTKQKNQTLLIRAFSMIANEFADYKLELYGDGEDKEMLSSLARELNLDGRVVFCGNRKDVLERIKSASLFAFSSDYEGLPNALAEALAIGLPCVSTDCTPGGARMLIENGENGFIVPVNQPKPLADAMKTLLSDKELSEKFSKNAVMLREKASLDRVVDMWEKYLSDMVR